MSWKGNNLFLIKYHEKIINSCQKHKYKYYHIESVYSEGDHLAGPHRPHFDKQSVCVTLAGSSIKAVNPEEVKMEGFLRGVLCSNDIMTSARYLSRVSLEVGQLVQML